MVTPWSELSIIIVTQLSNESRTIRKMLKHTVLSYFVYKLKGLVHHWLILAFCE